MKTTKIVFWALIYHAMIILSVVWYGVKGVALVIVACASVAAITRLTEKDETEDEVERESCEGCIHDLGGGHCRINMERECREGGGFELWEPKDGSDDEC